MMNLIDRYVADVGRRLPEQSRADIEKEIRSTLEDMLEDRSVSDERPIDENMTAEVLKEFGHPAKVAASYLPERYLIGPQLYPHFLKVVKISLVVALGVALIRMIVGIVQAGPEVGTIIESIVESFLSSGGIAISILGNVVLVFAVIEWALPNIKEEEKSEEWDPRSLPEITITPDTDKVSTADQIGTIIFTVIVMLVLNLYPQVIGIWFPRDGEWMSIPVFSEAFLRYLPWINILWTLEMTQALILLREGRWQPGTRWLSIVVDAVGLALTYAMLTGPSIIGITTANLQALGVPNPTMMVGLINAGVSIGLIVSFIVQAFEIIMTLYRLYFKGKKLETLLMLG